MASRQENLGPVARQICKQKDLRFGAAIGSGSFKQVFKVTDASGNILALKVLGQGASPLRIEREVGALLRVEHPNIGKFLGKGKTNFKGRAYEFMLEEYLSGGTLTERLLSQGPLDRAAILELGQPLIDVLRHLHELKLVHRDIKPDNIMFRAGELGPVLVDFGIVRDLTAASITGTFLPKGPGTAYYSSPEQLTNSKWETKWRSDQFSLGVTLYYCASGKHPFQFPSDDAGNQGIEQLLMRVAWRKSRSGEFYNFVRSIGLPVLIKMTEPWPINRYRTPNELAAAWAGQ